MAIALLQVLQSSSFTNTGEQMQRLEAERANRNAQIHELEAEVAALSSLDRIERSARGQLDMVPARNIDYISVQVQAPSGPLLPRPILNSAATDASRSEPWWQRIIRALSLLR